MPRKKKETTEKTEENWKKIKVNKDEWTPERFSAELLDKKTGKNLPFTDENKAALYSLTREEALQLEPRIFARWKFYYQNQEITKRSGTNSAKKRVELKDWSQQVRRMLSDPDLTATMINQRKMPKWINAFDTEAGQLPTPSEVIAATLMAKAMTGDVRAIEELRKMGFGDKVTLDAGESFFNKSALKLEIVDTTPETKALAKQEENRVEEETSPIPAPEPLPDVSSTEPIDVSPIINELQPIPENLKREFEQQEQQIANKASKPETPASNVNEHGIDRSLLNKVVITKNKPRV